MAYTLDISLALGSSQTGLTLSAQLVDTAGVNVGAAVTTGFVEVGAGNYLWHYTAFPDGHRGGVAFSAAETLKAFVAINPQEAENTDVKTSSRNSVTPQTAGQIEAAVWDAARAAHVVAGSMGEAERHLDADITSRAPAGATVTTTTPVSQSGAIELRLGIDDLAADGRALDFTDAANTWPTLTGATPTLDIGGTPGLRKTGTVLVATGNSKKVRFELTRTEKAALVVGAVDFDVEATLTSGHIEPLYAGRAAVLGNVGA